MSQVTDRESLTAAIERRQARDRGTRRQIFLISLAAAVAIHGVVLGMVIPGIYRFVYATTGYPSAQPVELLPVNRPRPTLMVDWGGALPDAPQPEPDFSPHPIDDWPRADLQAQWTADYAFRLPGSDFRISIPPLPPPARRDITDAPLEKGK